MINSITGKVLAYTDSVVTIDVGGLGFGVTVPSTMHVAPDQEVSLFVHMHWNQEQGPSLYGFTKELDKTVFLLITGCSGIGPKIAMTALAQLGSASFIQAVQQADDKVLSKISGIGAKKAEQIAVQLKHKVAKLIKSGVQIEGAQGAADIYNVAEVLQSLNYTRAEIDAATHWLQEQSKGVQVPFDKLVRQALSFLAKKG